MGASIAGFAVAAIVLVIGLWAGWHANRMYVANSDVKATRGRIAGYRKTRLRAGVIGIAVLIIAVFAIAAIVRR